MERAALLKQLACGGGVALIERNLSQDAERHSFIMPAADVPEQCETLLCHRLPLAQGQVAWPAEHVTCQADERGSSAKRIAHFSEERQALLETGTCPAILTLPEG